MLVIITSQIPDSITLKKEIASFIKINRSAVIACILSWFTSGDELCYFARVKPRSL